MSASRERKKRLELAEAGPSPKQTKAIEAKKKKTKNTLIGIVIAVLVVAIIAGCAYGLVIRPSVLPRTTTALCVGDHKLSASEFSYYYYDSVNSFYQTYGSYLSFVMSDPSQPLDELVYDEETGKTWAEYFIETAAQSAKHDYAVYDEAVANGYTLSEDGKQTIEDGMKSLEETAKASGFTSLKQYINQIYGQGCTKSGYREYQRIRTLAAEYAQKIDGERTYTEEQIAAQDAENTDSYTNVTYRSFYLSASNYSSDEASETEEATEEDNTAALEAAKADADKMAKDSKGNEGLFIETAYNLSSDSSKESYENPDATLYENQTKEKVSTYMVDWLYDDAREEGDTTVISDDGSGYYVVYFCALNDNNYNTQNVRHILVTPELDEDSDEDGTMDASSEEAKAAAKAEAEQIFADWQAGAATEDSFAALADEKSDDGAKGGLYENIYQGQMVSSFNDWCYAEGRKAGDTDIVESDYGYHVMYYVGEGEVCRKSMVINDLKEADYNEWIAALTESYEPTIDDAGTAYLRTDLILDSTGSSTANIESLIQE